MSLVKLTSTETHDYCVVALPKEASDIVLSNEWLSFKVEGQRDFIPEIPGEILGVIGNGEFLGYEVVKELLGFEPEFMHEDQFIEILKEKGILVENPIEKPNIIEYIGLVFVPLDEAHESYQKYLKLWKEAESKLVKAVIIKVKK
jgi:hypothetical protein